MTIRIFQNLRLSLGMALAGLGQYREEEISHASVQVIEVINHQRSMRENPKATFGVKSFDTSIVVTCPG